MTKVTVRSAPRRALLAFASQRNVHTTNKKHGGLLWRYSPTDTLTA